MDRSRFELHVLCTHNLGNPETIRQFEDIGVKVHLLPGATNDNPQDFGRPGFRSREGIRTYIGLMSRVWRFLRHNRFQIVHIHNYSGNAIFAGTAALLSGCRKVITHDHTSVPEHWKTVVMWKIINRFYFRNIVQSEWGATVRARRGGQHNKVTVVLNGVDITHFSVPHIDDRLAARKKLGIGAKDFVALAIGRLADIKRYDRFIDALAYFTDRDDVTFVLGGSGPLEDALKAQVQRIGLGRKIIFTGWVDDPMDLYRAADVLVMPSDEREGTSLVLVEAMATGLPVISVDSPNQREMITEDSGLIADADPNAIAGAIKRLLDDRQELERLSTGARRMAERRFDIRRAAAEISDIYENAAK